MGDLTNIMVHVHPSRRFDQERARLARVQVDNSLDLGWQAQYLRVVTNFPWEYNGVRAVEVGDEQFCAFRPRSTHTVIVPHLFELGLVRPNQRHWLHDFDAYQDQAFAEGEPELAGADLGLATYGWMPKWNAGSIFFTFQAQEIFNWIRTEVYNRQTEDERALVSLTKKNYRDICGRIKELNITYNFGMRQVGENWQRALLPLRVLHFHPGYREKGGFNTRDIFFEGKNELGRPLVSQRLRDIFRHHGI